jgi:hypothetical protein
VRSPDPLQTLHSYGSLGVSPMMRSPAAAVHSAQRQTHKTVSPQTPCWLRGLCHLSSKGLPVCSEMLTTLGVSTFPSSQKSHLEPPALAPTPQSAERMNQQVCTLRG